MNELEFMDWLTMLAQQTEGELINWELSEYLPIGFLLAEEHDDKSCDSISQTFAATAILNGESITVSITETINIPSGKGDYYVELETDDFMKEWSLSFDEDYNSCPTDKLKEKFIDSPVVAFTNAVIPYLIKNCRYGVQEGLIGKRFYNEVGIPDETKRLPLVQKAKQCCDQDDFLGFHKMVLDITKR